MEKTGVPSNVLAYRSSMASRGRNAGACPTPPYRLVAVLADKIWMTLQGVGAANTSGTFGAQGEIGSGKRTAHSAMSVSALPQAWRSARLPDRETSSVSFLSGDQRRTPSFLIARANSECRFPRDRAPPVALHHTGEVVDLQDLELIFLRGEPSQRVSKAAFATIAKTQFRRAARRRIRCEGLLFTIRQCDKR